MPGAHCPHPSCSVAGLPSNVSIKVDPVAMIWSGALMLDYLGRSLSGAEQKAYLDAHDCILSAIEKVLVQGPHTPDLGGKASTTDLGQAISKLVQA